MENDYNSYIININDVLGSYCNLLLYSICSLESLHPKVDFRKHCLYAPMKKKTGMEIVSLVINSSIETLDLYILIYCHTIQKRKHWLLEHFFFSHFSRDKLYEFLIIKVSSRAHKCINSKKNKSYSTHKHKKQRLPWN